MNEEKTTQPGATTSMPVEAAPGEKHSAVIVRGISMPPHQVRMAIDQAVAREQLTEEDGEEAIWWLYNYAQANSLNESALAAKMKAYDKNTLYQVFRGSYGVNNKDGRHASWSNRFIIPLSVGAWTCPSAKSRWCRRRRGGCIQWSTPT